MSAGKGDKNRVRNFKGFRENYDKIKWNKKQVSSKNTKRKC